MASESKFDGTVLGLFGINLAAAIITMITLGFGFPWAMAMKIRYITRYSIVDGRRMIFDGTGAQLFGTWVKVFLLSIITLGIYSFWAERELWRWIVQHTHCETGL